jgi:hypothetical protein
MSIVLKMTLYAIQKKCDFSINICKNCSLPQGTEINMDYGKTQPNACSSEYWSVASVNNGVDNLS